MWIYRMNYKMMKTLKQYNHQYQIKSAEHFTYVEYEADNHVC